MIFITIFSTYFTYSLIHYEVILFA